MKTAPAPSPQVSVLLPVRNGAETLAEAIQSISAQTLTDFELIVVDDGSEDQTPDVIRRLAAFDPRIRAVRQPARGIVAALQEAITHARAPFFARMDADDMAHPGRLARQVAWLRRRPELGAVGSLVSSLGQNPGNLGWQRYLDWLNGRRTPEAIQRDIFIESPLAHPSVLIRRSALEQVGGYRDFDGPEDYDLWLRLAAAGWRLAKVPAYLLAWRDHPERLTRTDPRYRNKAFLKLKAYHLARGPLSGQDRRRPLWIWGAGRYGPQLSRALEQEGIDTEAFIDIDPVKIGRQRRGCPVEPPMSLKAHPEALVLAAVPVIGARTLIRRRLTRMGRTEGVDYWCCA